MDVVTVIIFIFQILLLYLIYKKNGISNILFVISFSFFIYGNSYLIDYWLFNSYINSIDERFYNIYLLFSSFIFILSLGYLFNRIIFFGSVKKINSKIELFNVRSIELIYSFLFVLYGYFFFVYFDTAISDRNYLYLNPNSVLSLVKLIIPFYFILICYLSENKINKFYLIVFIMFCFSELFIFGDRRGVASALISIFMIHNRFNVVKIKSKLIFFLIFFVILMIYIEKTRYGGDFFSDTDYSSLNPAVTELGAPWLVALDIFNDVNFLGINIDSILNAFLNLVPHFFWSERPLGAAAWFAQKYYPDIAEQGGGFAFSFIIEIVINFSLIGYFLFVFLFGFFIAFLNNKNLSKWGVLLFVVFSLNFIFLPRYDFSTILKTIFIYFIFIIPLLIFNIRNNKL